MQGSKGHTQPHVSPIDSYRPQPLALSLAISRPSTIFSGTTFFPLREHFRDRQTDRHSVHYSIDTSRGGDTHSLAATLMALRSLGRRRRDACASDTYIPRIIIREEEKERRAVIFFLPEKERISMAVSRYLPPAARRAYNGVKGVTRANSRVISCNRCTACVSYYSVLQTSSRLLIAPSMFATLIGEWRQALRVETLADIFFSHILSFAAGVSMRELLSRRVSFFDGKRSSFF